jgi:hypothetical protein
MFQNIFFDFVAILGVIILKTGVCRRTYPIVTIKTGRFLRQLFCAACGVFVVLCPDLVGVKPHLGAKCYVRAPLTPRNV